MRAAATVLTALLLLTGCRVGGSSKNFPPANGPEGARVAVRVRGETADRVGELFAVDSAGLTIRAARLVRIRWPAVTAIDVDRLGGDYDVYPGRPADAAHRVRLAAVSRFPQGLSGDLLARVLDKLGQPALDDLP